MRLSRTASQMLTARPSHTVIRILTPRPEQYLPVRRRVKSFVNTNNTYGKLKVEKSVKGNGADTDKSFKFTVKLTGASSYGTIKATYTKGDETGDIEFAADDYSCEFELKDGESITIDGLPTGVKYTVTEDDYSDDGYTTTSTGETGTIAANGTKTSKFVNTYSNTSSVKITKKLEGNDVSGVTDPFTIYITTV